MKAKVNLLVIVLWTMSIHSSLAQIVTENILFDNYISPTNNDFTNRFTGGLGLTQITTDGIKRWRTEELFL